MKTKMEKIPNHLNFLDLIRQKSEEGKTTLDLHEFLQEEKLSRNSGNLLLPFFLVLGGTYPGSFTIASFIEASNQ